MLGGSGKNMSSYGSYLSVEGIGIERLEDGRSLGRLSWVMIS